MALEPLHEYVVEVERVDGQKVCVNTLAHSPWHAAEKIHTKFQQLQPDRSKYSPGKRVWQKKSMHSLN